MEPTQYVEVQFFFIHWLTSREFKLQKLENGEKAQKKFTITVVHSYTDQEFCDKNH